MAQIPPKNAVVDPKTGVVTPEWLFWLQSIADRTTVAGGTTPGSGTGGTGGTGSTGGTGGTGGGDGPGITVVNDYGSGTPDKIAKWIAAQKLGDSLLSESGGTVTVGGALSVAGVLTATTIQGTINVSSLGGSSPNTVLLAGATGPPRFAPDIPFHLLPTQSDAYDLGRFDRLWRHGWISTINAIVFAETTQTIFGGYSSIVKNAGSFNRAVANTDDTIDFGTALPVGDYVLVRAHDAFGAIRTEYVQIGALTSDGTGTRYTVTRDVTGLSSPDPTWATGTPWMNLGTTGDGRIDFFAYDGKPKMLYNVQGVGPTAFSTRTIVGNLNGYFGYVTDAFGACFGDPAGAWVKIDDIAGSSGGVRLGYAGTTTVKISSAGASSFEAGITLGASGGLLSASCVIDAQGIKLGPLPVPSSYDHHYAYNFFGPTDDSLFETGTYAYEPTVGNRVAYLQNSINGNTLYPGLERHIFLSCQVPNGGTPANYASMLFDAFPPGHSSGITGRIAFNSATYVFIGTPGGDGEALFAGDVTILGTLTAPVLTAELTAHVEALRAQLRDVTAQLRELRGEV